MSRVYQTPPWIADGVDFHGDPWRVLSVKLPAEVAELVEVAASLRGQTVSEWLREVIWDGLKTEVPGGVERLLERVRDAA